MIRILNLKMPVEHKTEQLKEKIAGELRIPVKQIQSYDIVKRSIDARKQPIQYVYQINVTVVREKKVIQKNSRHKNIMLTEPVDYLFPKSGHNRLLKRPVVVGCGPAGLFCAYMLAKHGYYPLILERGDEASLRRKKVSHFWKTGVLDESSNVQFGEGGAGTFSDGKLNTLVKDPFGRNKEVLKIFVDAGAPSSILYDQKPHLGTDLLVQIVQRLRRQIEAMGGEFRFHSQVTDLVIEDGRVKGLEVNKKEVLSCQVVILAIGHSARDTFSMLSKNSLHMEEKSFAVGVRIEHPQKMITEDQYGKNASAILGPASYKLTHKLADSRGIYSFCMCPGGYVVNASSQTGFLAVNGMSYHGRNSLNANSALVVTVNPSDYREYHEAGNSRCLDGVFFQRHLERAAWQLAAGKVPVQLFEDFKENRRSVLLGEISPCIMGKYELSNVREILPPVIGESIADGIRAFGEKIKGFDRPDALISGVESRTSSPVKIIRDESFESSLKGLYPCGEGAGYAGGITSAAMDGIKAAEAVCKKYMKL